MDERWLRPGRLIELESGLWAVDQTQPVAAVLDPVTGDVRQIVAWPQLPPPPPGEEPWPSPRVLGDGIALWAQQEPAGPLVRITPEGTEGIWTDGLFLAATGPGVAWCAPVGPEQEVVQGAEGTPFSEPGPDVLLRVAADGSTRTIRTENPVRAVYSNAEALLVEVDVEPWHLNDLGAGTYEVEWETRWLCLFHDAEIPPLLTLESHGVDASVGAQYDDGGAFHGSWYDTDDEEPLRAVGFDWYLGWSTSGRRGLRRRVVASANHDKEQVHGWDLGEGTVLAAAPAAGRLVVAIAREALGPVDLIALHPDAEDAETLLAAEVVDIAANCWPVGAKPLDADSYAARTLAALDIDGLVDGMAHPRTELVGEWPTTRLQWHFTLGTHPGVTFRRRLRLFDELGRIDPPLYADIHLAEDVETGQLPPPDEAAAETADGMLDI